MNIRIVLFILTLSLSLYAQAQTYVIMISFDGFRWDYANRGITPNLDEMKNNGVHALSLKPAFPTKTFPNHYSIISGMYPENHGIIFNSFINPFTKEGYRLGDTTSVREGKWYLGEAFWETAERNGIKTASYFWPGSELKDKNRRPSYYKHYEHNLPYKERIDGVIDWLKLPQEKRPHFITIYFHDTDSYGHEYGPNSNEINQSIQRLDSLINYLYLKLDETEVYDSTNVIVVSDHGMTEISLDRTINIESMLCGYDVLIDGSKPLMMIKPDEEDFNDVMSVLKKNEEYYKVYTKNNMPAYFNFNKHPFIYPIILVADIGWSLVTNNWMKSMEEHYSVGNHGYDNNYTDMHGVFIAEGPSFKKGYKIGTVQNVDIYPLLCELFKIEPRSNIDGKLDNIRYILK